jgi:hypothetical protein
LPVSESDATIIANCCVPLAMVPVCLDEAASLAIEAAGDLLHCH